MVSPIKGQQPVLTAIQGLLQAGYGNDIVQDESTDTAGTKKSWNEVLNVLVDAIFDFYNFCVTMLSNDDTVSSQSMHILLELI
jgi:hypothetical protein